LYFNTFGKYWSNIRILHIYTIWMLSNLRFFFYFKDILVLINGRWQHQCVAIRTIRENTKNAVLGKSYISCYIKTAIRTRNAAECWILPTIPLLITVSDLVIIFWYPRWSIDTSIPPNDPTPYNRYCYIEFLFINENIYDYCIHTLNDINLGGYFVRLETELLSKIDPKNALRPMSTMEMKSVQSKTKLKKTLKLTSS